MEKIHHMFYVLLHNLVEMSLFDKFVEHILLFFSKCTITNYNFKNKTTIKIVQHKIQSLED